MSLSLRARKCIPILIGYDARRSVPMKRLRIAMLFGVMVIAAAPIDASAAECNRTCLTGLVDTYFKALAANAPATVPLAPAAKVTLNGRAVPLAQAFWD